MSHARPGFVARRTLPPPAPRLGKHEVRAAWRRVIALAAVQAKATIDGTPVGRDAAAVFTREVIDVSRLDFPLEHVSARNAGEAFITVARGFVAAARPQDRLPLARFMGAGAEALEQLFVNAADDAAQGWKKQFGEG